MICRNVEVIRVSIVCWRLFKIGTLLSTPNLDRKHGINSCLLTLNLEKIRE